MIVVFTAAVVVVVFDVFDVVAVVLDDVDVVVVMRLLLRLMVETSVVDVLVSTASSSTTCSCSR